MLGKEESREKGKEESKEEVGEKRKKGFIRGKKGPIYMRKGEEGL